MNITSLVLLHSILWSFVNLGNQPQSSEPGLELPFFVGSSTCDRQVDSPSLAEPRAVGGHIQLGRLSKQTCLGVGTSDSAKLVPRSDGNSDGHLTMQKSGQLTRQKSDQLTRHLCTLPTIFNIQQNYVFAHYNLTLQYYIRIYVTLLCLKIGSSLLIIIDCLAVC